MKSLPSFWLVFLFAIHGLFAQEPERKESEIVFAATVQVDPEGPIPDLPAARDAVRKMKLEGILSGPVQVVIAAGIYRITEPVVFGHEDTGSPETAILYRAADDAEVVISGGRVISGWKPNENGLWTTEIPEIPEGIWGAGTHFEQLYINDRLARKAEIATGNESPMIAGEWHLDRESGVLSYSPLPGEKIEATEFIAPVAESLIFVKGSISKDESLARSEPVGNLVFRNIRFRHTNHISDPGQVSNSSPAIKIEGGRNIVFEKCEISQIAGTGIRLSRGSSSCDITESNIHELAGSGICIGNFGGEGEPSDADGQRNNVIECAITRGGILDPDATGIRIAHSSANKILHNEISEFPNTGITVGGEPGYAPSRSHNNTIQFNLIHDLGRGASGNLAGVRTYGISPGTSVSNNVIRDIRSGENADSAGWGINLDEGSTGILVENNLVYRTNHGSFRLDYGKDNIIRNNIFAFSRDGQIRVSKLEDHSSFKFERNIVLWSEGDVFPTDQVDLSNKNFEMKSNLYWCADAKGVRFLGKELSQWQEEGMEEGSVIADPLFENAVGNDFRLKENSKAVDIGFKSFDYGTAGLSGN